MGALAKPRAETPEAKLSKTAPTRRRNERRFVAMKLNGGSFRNLSDLCRLGSEESYHREITEADDGVSRGKPNLDTLDAFESEHAIQMAAAKAEDEKIFNLTIVLPVRDEAAALGAVLNDLCVVLAKSSIEVIALIDTRSTDRSAQILEDYAAGLSGENDPPTLRIISLVPPRCGSGTARAIGSRGARGKLIAWMDADGTYSASDLGRLANAIGTADQVVGARSCDFGRAGGLRFFVKSAVARLAALLWHRIDLVDLNSGLRIFRRSSLLAWVDELPPGFSCTTTATLAALNHGQNVCFERISYFPRAPGAKSKFHPLLDTARLLRVVWRQWRNKSTMSRPSDRAD